jgi:hypothetical protein
MSASIFLRRGSSSRKAATKTRIRMNTTAAPIHRKSFLVTSLSRCRSTFLAMKPLEDVLDDCRCIFVRTHRGNGQELCQISKFWLGRKRRTTHGSHQKAKPKLFSCRNFSLSAERKVVKLGHSGSRPPIVSAYDFLSLDSKMSGVFLAQCFGPNAWYAPCENAGAVSNG